MLPLERLDALIRRHTVESFGPVRSVALVSDCPIDEIETLALDLSSRTSVVLARVLLAQRKPEAKSELAAYSVEVVRLRKRIQEESRKVVAASLSSTGTVRSDW